MRTRLKEQEDTIGDVANMADVCRILFLAMLLHFHLFDVYAGVVTVRIDEYEKVCFGYDFKKDTGEVNADVQVNRGGNTEINWKVLDPKGNVLISEDHVSQAEHNFDVQIDGEYKICLDNTFSSDEKVVTIAVEHDLPDEMTVLLEKIHAKKQILKLPPGISNISQVLLKNAMKLIRYHEIHAAKQKRHYFLVDSNLSRVNGFSLLSCAIVITVGIVQVFIVKSLFQDGTKSRI